MYMELENKMERIGMKESEYKELMVRSYGDDKEKGSYKYDKEKIIWNTLNKKK